MGLLMSAVLSPSNVVGVVAVNSPGFIAAVFQALSAGRIVTFLRSPRDEERRVLAAVTEVLEPEAGSGWFSPSLQERPAGDLALVAFTSGTEGKPKGVALRHGALSDVVARLAEVMAVDASIREYVGVPVYHSFGFGRCRAIASVGGQAYLPPDGFNPLEVADMLRRGEINAISAVPSLWRTVLEAEEDFVGLGAEVRWIEIGSQYMSRAEKEGLRRLFPNAKIVQHYGLTEASRSTLLLIHHAQGDELESVGRALGEVEVSLTSDRRIRIRGPHVTCAVLSDGVWQDPRDTEGWLTTSDLGREENGVLYFEGRADDVINCGGIKLAPERLEEGVRRRTGISEGFAVGRVPDRIRGDGILLACTPQTSGSAQVLLEALVEEAATSGVSVRGACRVIEVERLPLTPTGKVQRKALTEESGKPVELSERTAGALVGTAPSGGPRNQEEEELLAIWRQALGLENIGVEESFYDLGGDSVTALGVVVRMSRAGIDMKVCRRIFQGATIRQLADARRGDSGTTEAGAAAATPTGAGRDEYLSTLMVNVLRGILVGSVVLGHWSPGTFDRLPEEFSLLKAMMAPFFSFGTPGFAMAFGTGFGFLYLAKYRDNPGRLWNVVKLGTTIVGAGVLLFALMRLAVSEYEVTYANFFEFFYSALTFYLLAVPTMPLWIAGLSRLSESRRVPAALILAVICHVLGLTLREVIPTQQPDGFLRLVRLMLVAKYSYFTMMGGVLLGVAVGSYVRSHGVEGGLSRKLGLTGLATIGGAVAVAFVLGQEGYLSTWPSPLTGWKWIFYLGVVLLILAGLFALRNRYATLPLFWRRSIEGVATVGQLALPFYVFHETIVPLKRLLFQAGVPDGAATALSMALFVLGSWLMIRRVVGLFQSD